MIVVLLQVELENGVQYNTESIKTNKEYNTCIFKEDTTNTEFIFEPKEIYSIKPITVNKR